MQCLAVINLHVRSNSIIAGIAQLLIFFFVSLGILCDWNEYGPSGMSLHLGKIPFRIKAASAIKGVVSGVVIWPCAVPCPVNVL